MGRVYKNLARDLRPILSHFRSNSWLPGRKRLIWSVHLFTEDKWIKPIVLCVKWINPQCFESRSDALTKWDPLYNGLFNTYCITPLFARGRCSTHQLINPNSSKKKKEKGLLHYSCYMSAVGWLSPLWNPRGRSSPYDKGHKWLLVKGRR